MRTRVRSLLQLSGFSVLSESKTEAITTAIITEATTKSEAGRGLYVDPYLWLALERLGSVKQ